MVVRSIWDRSPLRWKERRTGTHVRDRVSVCVRSYWENFDFGFFFGLPNYPGTSEITFQQSFLFWGTTFCMVNNTFAFVSHTTVASGWEHERDGRPAGARDGGWVVVQKGSRPGRAQDSRCQVRLCQGLKHHAIIVRVQQSKRLQWEWTTFFNGNCCITSALQMYKRYGYIAFLSILCMCMSSACPSTLLHRLSIACFSCVHPRTPSAGAQVPTTHLSQSRYTHTHKAGTVTYVCSHATIYPSAWARVPKKHLSLKKKAGTL